MKQLTFATQREMQVDIAIANQELAITMIFCGKEYQCFFEGTYREGKRSLPWKVCENIMCMACMVPRAYPLVANRPESATGIAFQMFLNARYGNIQWREKKRPAHKRGRPKDGENKKA